ARPGQEGPPGAEGDLRPARGGPAGPPGAGPRRAGPHDREDPSAGRPLSRAHRAVIPAPGGGRVGETVAAVIRWGTTRRARGSRTSAARPSPTAASGAPAPGPSPGRRPPAARRR